MAPPLFRAHTAAGALAALALLSGCSSDDAGSAGGTSSTTTTAAAPTTVASGTSSTSSTAAGAGTIGPEEARQRGIAALLPEGAMAKVGFSYATKPEAGNWGWYEPCAGKLPSDRQVLGGAHARWTDGKRTVDQVVAYYPPGVANVAVEQAGALTTCSAWTFPDGTRATAVTQRELDTIAGVSAQASWCESIKAVSRCTAVVAVGDAVSRVWVLSDPVSDTQETLDTFATLSAARLASQPG